MKAPALALGAKQVGAAIGVCPRTVQNLWASGELPYVVIRNKRRTLQWQLRRWLRRQEQKGAA